MAFTFAAFTYICALIIDAFLIFFAIDLMSVLGRVSVIPSNAPPLETQPVLFYNIFDCVKRHCIDKLGSFAAIKTKYYCLSWRKHWKKWQHRKESQFWTKNLALKYIVIFHVLKTFLKSYCGGCCDGIYELVRSSR